MRKNAQQREYDRKVKDQLDEQKRLAERGSQNSVIHMQSHEYGIRTFTYNDIDEALNEFSELIESSRDAWVDDRVDRTLTLKIKINKRTA